MTPLRDYFLAPAAAGCAAGREDRPPGGRPRRRERAAIRSLGVIAGMRDLASVACSAGLMLGARAPAVLVGLHGAGDPSQAPRAPGRVAAVRLAASLDARGLQAGARGRLVVVALPGDAREAAVAWSRADGAASDVPTVLGVSMRHDELDVPLAAQDAIVIALSPAAPANLAALALAGIEGLVPAASVVSGRAGPVARTLAVAGVWPVRSVRSAVEGALG
jgi:hypothetical protein